ncbi:cupin domain-containing protein [Luteimicrobium sp. DT211]|uniref:cupin domain-containing protein n=1 Tax=Luteimicrobium sp. DT211 TaxID=3393412 RepID=UPI003CF2DBB3
MADVVNLAAAFDSFDDTWQPRRLVSVNDYDVKAVRLEGEFVWHSHPETDELFMVRSGRLVIQQRDAEGKRHDVELGPGDVYVVPRGVEHCPRTEGAVTALLFEPRGTVNTGDAGGERTAELQEPAADD